MRLVTIILGTRPEAIKLAPVIKIFENCPHLDTRLILTGQHKEMVYQVLNIFKISPQKDLGLMAKNQTLTHITFETLSGLESDFNQYKPDLVIVQGDTSTAFAASLAAFYAKIPVAHVEAGLRTESKLNPYPEEINRRLISQIADLHFAPTEIAKLNLNKSGIKNNIFITGNTVIDALLSISNNVKAPLIKNLDWSNKKIILVTVHRRENWGDNLLNISIAIKKLAQKREDICFLIPMHKNKVVRQILEKELSKIINVFLIEPLNYDEQIGAIKGSNFVMTDSGGLQEEVPTLGKPILVLRDNTERPEAITAGTAKLIGTKTENIIREVNVLLNNKIEYEKMSKSVNPFGDGKSSSRILDHCLNFIFKKVNQNKLN